MSLLEVADRLYALPLDQFTAARNTAAKDADDRGLAGEIRGLRKPSATAWVVNQLVRHRREEVEALLELGQSLRDAQDDLDPVTLRSLGQQRRKVVTALARRAAGIADDLGHTVAPSTSTEVEQTLQAAMTDPAAAEAIRTARLLRSLNSSGIEPVDLTDAVAVPTSGGDQGSGHSSTRPPRQSREERRERELAEATASAEEADRWSREADGALEHVGAKLAAASDRRAELEGAAERLRHELAELEEQISAADEESRQLDSEREAAVRAARSARRASDRARERVEYLS